METLIWQEPLFPEGEIDGGQPVEGHPDAAGEVSPPEGLSHLQSWAG